MQPVLKTGETSISAYGKHFHFPRRGSDDHYHARAVAEAAAVAYGRQVLEAMRSQKQAPLSRREIVEGRLATPSAPQPVMSLRQPQPGPDDNPYRARLAELMAQRPMLAADRGRLARRIAAIRDLHDGWEQTRAAERVLEVRNADEKIVIMREHARSAFDHSRLDSRATPAEVAERRKLLEYANSDSSQPADYWTVSDEADSRWFKRLDEIAAEKKAAVDAARAELDEAKQTAKAARKLDPVAEQVQAEQAAVAEPEAEEAT